MCNKQMNPIKRWKAKVLNGKLTLKSTKLWNQNLKHFEGKEVEVCIQRYRKTRSLQGNRYYWGVIIPLTAEYCGYDDQEMHEALKIKFLSKKGIIPTVISTTKLDTAQFSDYIEKIKRWASVDLGLVIPEPEEVWVDMSKDLEKEIKG